MFKKSWRRVLECVKHLEPRFVSASSETIIRELEKYKCIRRVFLSFLFVLKTMVNWKTHENIFE